MFSLIQRNAYKHVWVTGFSGKPAYQEMHGFAGREKQPQSGALGTVDFRNFIVFVWAETLAHWNPTSCQKNIHNQFVRIWDSQIENSKIEIMETDRTATQQPAS